MPFALNFYAQLYHVSLSLLEMDEVNLNPNINNPIAADEARNADIGGHVEVNTTMLSHLSGNSESNSTECYPRLGDILDVVDRLTTYIYNDGFLPIVRAHVYASIPLKRGRDAMESFLDDG